MKDITVVNKFVPGTQAYSAYDSVNDRIVVSFRGSWNVPNWVENLDTLKTDYQYCPGCQVHMGFLVSY
jgi:hypothetical protein